MYTGRKKGHFGINSHFKRHNQENINGTKPFQSPALLARDIHIGLTICS